VKPNFERWHPAMPARRQAGPYIRFSRGKALFLNIAFCDLLQRKNLHRFDVYVDKKARVIGLKFFRDEAGHYHIKTKPGQFGFSSFVNQHKPVLGKRLPVTWNEESGMWIAQLDGKRVPDFTD